MALKDCHISFSSELLMHNTNVFWFSLPNTNRRSLSLKPCQMAYVQWRSLAIIDEVYPPILT